MNPTLCSICHTFTATEVVLEPPFEAARYFCRACYDRWCYEHGRTPAPAPAKGYWTGDGHCAYCGATIEQAEWPTGVCLCCGGSPSGVPARREDETVDAWLDHFRPTRIGG